jgi:phage terminase large subunit GpA-like protein
MSAQPSPISGAFVDVDDIVARAMGAWRPPPRLSLSEWADEYYYLSAETAAEPGRWRTIPYQREIMDAFTDPKIRIVVVMKSARVGFTLMLMAMIGYYMHQDPTSIMVVQPTVDDAKGWSKESLAPMLRDVPVLAAIAVRDVEEKSKSKGKKKDGSDTLLLKTFPGGVLDAVGANSGTGFRRKSRRVVGFDEVDAYPASAGDEGDQISLGLMRSQAFYNRKAVLGSTPLIAGASRIEDQFLAGDQRRYHVPCPTCGHKDFLVFDREAARGHRMRWPDDPEDPSKAYFVCRGKGCRIEHKDKRWMVERGEWIPDNPSSTTRSYHLWAALSYSPNATWAHIATEFLAAKKDPDKLKTFVNTTLGETWKEKGDAPEWERLYHRREKYAIGTVPEGVIALTAGVDVQKDRLMYEVVGWAINKENWSIDAGALMGDTSLPNVWHKLDELLARAFMGHDGAIHTIGRLAVDSGYNTQVVYNWARQYPMDRVIATKGMAGARAILGAASPVEITSRGKTLRRGYKVWPIGVDIAKSELYGWLRLEIAEDGSIPPGFCHFPEHSEEFFKQLTAEHLVTSVNKKKGRTRLEWHVLPNRENHQLDCRVMARAAVNALGIDRFIGPALPRSSSTAPSAAHAPGTAPAPSSPPSPNEAPISADQPAPPRAGFWKQSPAPRRSSWFKSRR